MTATIVPALAAQNLVYVERGKLPAQFSIIAFSVDGDSVTPITFPKPPQKARIYLVGNGSFQPFDLSTGAIIGGAVSSVVWE